MRKVIFLSIVLLLNFFSKAASPYDEYLVQLKKVMTNSTVTYNIHYSFPDGSKSSARGKMAISNRNYYDSSNARLVLLNSKWFLSADHINKYITVFSMEKAAKGMNGMGDLSMSSYLYGEDFLDKLDVKSSSKNGDTITLVLVMPDEPNIEKLEVDFLKSKKLPVSYSLVMKCQLSKLYMDDDIDPSEFVKIDMVANSVSYPANAGLFDDKRFIEQKGDKAIMKKFRNYKTIKN